MRGEKIVLCSPLLIEVSRQICTVLLFRSSLAMGKGNRFQNMYTQNIRTRCPSLHCYTTPLNICPLAFISFINEELLFQFSERANPIAVIPIKEKPFRRSLAYFRYVSSQNIWKSFVSICRVTPPRITDQNTALCFPEN